MFPTSTRACASRHEYDHFGGKRPDPTDRNGSSSTLNRCSTRQARDDKAASCDKAVSCDKAASLRQGLCHATKAASCDKAVSCDKAASCDKACVMAELSKQPRVTWL